MQHWSRYARLSQPGVTGLDPPKPVVASVWVPVAAAPARAGCGRPVDASDQPLGPEETASPHRRARGRAGAPRVHSGTSRALPARNQPIKRLPTGAAPPTLLAEEPRQAERVSLDELAVSHQAGAMPKRKEIDLRAAINAISDVVQNRPRPLREFDQIYMKTGDMVLQSELVARWADGKRLAFIGDGDAISVCVAYLKERGIIDSGPSKIGVYDFDGRICGAVERFADRERLEQLQAKQYNCIYPFPDLGRFDCFYTNPPWGASNEGASVRVFVRRGMEAVGYVGEGMVVVADDDELDWTKRVLANTQRFALESGFFVNRLMPQMHQYHLDDAPNLRSCNLLLKPQPGNGAPGPSVAIDASEIERFYGRAGSLIVRYVIEKKRLDYGKAHEDEYELEYLESSK